MTDRFFDDCADLPLEGLVRRRMAEADNHHRYLSPTSRRQLREWLAGEHREVRRNEGRDWDEDFVRDVILSGELTWQQVDDEILQHQGVLWMSRGVLIAHSLFYFRDLGFRALLDIEVLYHSGSTSAEDRERRMVVYSLTGVDPSDALGQILDLLGACHGYSMTIIGPVAAEFCVPAETLGRFLAVLRCKSIRFMCTRFSLDHCQALARCRRTLTLELCRLQDLGHSILEGVGRGEGPAVLRLQHLEIDTSSLAGVLRTSTNSLKELHITNLYSFDMPLFLNALEQNQGLTWLSFVNVMHVVEPVWYDLFRSIRVHPSLRHLSFVVTTPEGHQLELGDRVEQTRAIVDTLKTNTALQRLDMVPGQVDEQIMENEVRPRLRANASRARTAALADEEDMSFQRRLIGAALVHEQVRCDPTAMFVMVSNFYEFIAEQYEATRERLSAGPVSGRTRSRKRLRED